MTDTTADVVDAKTIATLKARAALAGYELTALPDGSFLIARWGMHRDLAHANDVKRFLDRVRPRSEEACS